MNSMKATAIAPANIAFIKYWGKANDALRIPLNSSFSMNISGAYTTTTVEFSPRFIRDDIVLLADSQSGDHVRGIFSELEKKRIIEHLDRIRLRAGVTMCANVVTQNSFPKSSGAASSASGFAALTVAASAALQLHVSEKELTILARLGSGSACRSIPDGFVVWEAGKKSEDSYAYSLHPSTYWELRDILVIVDHSSKKVSTSDGMKTIQSSPLLSERLHNIPHKMVAIQTAFIEKDFEQVGTIIEEDCLSMHRVMQTQNPPINYWNAVTEHLMKEVVSWRKAGLAVYFTIDAGPNVHLICEAIDEKRVVDKVRTIKGVESIIVNAPAPGTRLTKNHLF